MVEITGGLKTTSVYVYTSRRCVLEYCRGAAANIEIRAIRYDFEVVGDSVANSLYRYRVAGVFAVVHVDLDEFFSRYGTAILVRIKSAPHLSPGEAALCAEGNDDHFGNEPLLVCIDYDGAIPYEVLDITLTKFMSRRAIHTRGMVMMLNCFGSRSERRRGLC